jgi:hypothetical protein
MEESQGLGVKRWWLLQGSLQSDLENEPWLHF